MLCAAVLSHPLPHYHLRVTAHRGTDHWLRDEEAPELTLPIAY
jgi:hypothetical protein